MEPVGLGREVGEGAGDVTRVLIGVPKSTDDILEQQSGAYWGHQWGVKVAQL